MPQGLAGRLLRHLGVIVSLAIISAGCLKSLDESLLETGDAGHDAGGKDGGGTGGTGAKDGGTGATGGTGGADGGGTDGGGTGGADADAGGIVAYDPTKFPVTVLTTATAPVVMATDDTDVFYTIDDGDAAPLSSVPLTGGAGTTLLNLDHPHALVAPPLSAFVFAAGGHDSTSGGTLIRTAKVSASAETITTVTGSMGPGVGIYASTDGFGYVTFQADPSLHKPALARFNLSAGVASAPVLYNAATDESGGRVVTVAGCACWISSGHIFTIPSGGAQDRSSALQNQVSDAVGITADAWNIYYTLAGGSVWFRAVSSACDGSGPAEKQLAQGFTGLSDVIAFGAAPIIAWAAQGNQSAGFAGGGLYMMPSSGGQITQIAPKDSGPTTLIDAPLDVVYAVTTGEIRKVPKP